MTDWHRDLNTAPRSVPDGKALLVLIDTFPESVEWHPYPDDIARELGEDGYWNYTLDLARDVGDGAIPSHDAATARWCLIDLPQDQPDSCPDIPGP